MNGEADFSTPVTVEFEDVDSYRIAHHTKLVAYLERARARFIMDLGLDVAESRVVPVVYDLQVRFRKPARLFDRLEVTVSLREFNGYWLVLNSRITRMGDTLVRAVASIAFCDLDEQTMVEAPAAYADALARLHPSCGS